jgi:3-oxoacyl-[acyl-carrier-protein] synthase II
MARRVVVTSMGAVSPLGLDFQSSFASLLRGESGLSSLKVGIDLAQTQISPTGTAATADFVPGAIEASIPSQVCAPVHFQSPKAPQNPSRFITFALMAADDALKDISVAGDSDGKLALPSSFESERFGVALGSGIGSISTITNAYDTLVNRSIRKISPHFVPNILANLAGAHVAMKYKLEGPNHAVSTACATSAHSIGDAYRFIKYGDADVMLAGGSEASIDALSMAGFSRLRALSTKYNDEPKKASRPFDENRDGFVMGEGAAVLLLGKGKERRERRKIERMLALGIF